MSARRLSKEELEEIRRVTRESSRPHSERWLLLEHIEALEAELLATEQDPPRGSRCWRCEVELTKARAEVERLRECLRPFTARLAERNAEVERLREALEWYASECNFHMLSLAQDGGDRARNALGERSSASPDKEET